MNILNYRNSMNYKRAVEELTEYELITMLIKNENYLL